MTTSTLTEARLLAPGARVVGEYTLRPRHGRGRLSIPRMIVGTLRRVRWLSPTVPVWTVRGDDGIEYVIDSRLGEVYAA